MEAKVLSEEISLSMKPEEKWSEALAVYRDIQRKFTQRSNHFGNTNNGSGNHFSSMQPRSISGHGKNPGSYSPHGHSYSSNGGSSAQSQPGYQPRFRARGPEKLQPVTCDFCLQEGYYS
jgi:hypothetical protein